MLDLKKTMDKSVLFDCMRRIFYKMKYVNKITVILLLFLTGFPAVKPHETENVPLTDKERSWLRENRVAFAGNAGQLPFEAVDENGNYAGIIAGHVEYLENALGTRFEKKITGKTSQKNSQADIVSGDAVDRILNKNFRPVEAGLKNPVVIVTKNSHPFVDSISEISGNKIAVHKYHGYIQEIYRKYPGPEYSEVENIQEGLLGVESGKYDAMLLPLASASFAITEMSAEDLAIAGKTDVFINPALFVRKDKPELYSIVSKAMRAMPAANRLKLLENWRHNSVVMQKDISLFWQAFGLMTLVAGFVFFRQRTLGKYARELEKQKELYDLVLEKSSSSVLIIDIDANRFIDCNKQAVEILKCNSRADVLNFQPAELSPEYQPDGQRSDEKSDEMNSIATRNGTHTFEWKHLTATNEEFWVEVILTLIELDGRKVLHVVWKDIGARKAAEEKLQQQKSILDFQAHHDALTSLPNRVLLSSRIGQAIQKASRTGNAFALLFIDLDRFKKINDSLGHAVGDQVLQVVAARLQGVIRHGDTLARQGGDEFTILMDDLKDEEAAAGLSIKLIEVLAEPVFIDKHTFYISTSIGISLYPRDAADEHSLLKYADTAMYKAKEDGRNNFRFYSADMTEMAIEHVLMENSLRHALQNDELVVYYQPQVNGRSGELTGMEALVRWQHPELGLIPPARFLPVAEETGLIVRLDQWVMKNAIRQFVRWHEEGKNPGILALNLSMKQLQQKNYVEQLRMEISAANCNPEWLELEIAESQLMKNPDESISILRQLSAMGIKLSIDDFGTGYSSLSYLKRLPINKLKIDQSFIRDLPADEEDASIIRAVIALSQSLGLTVIAEGVELDIQKEFLVSNGCENIQGYFYSSPVPGDVIDGILLKPDPKFI